jgi:hypothetical protein
MRRRTTILSCWPWKPTTRPSSAFARLENRSAPGVVYTRGSGLRAPHHAKRNGCKCERLKFSPFGLGYEGRSWLRIQALLLGPRQMPNESSGFQAVATLVAQTTPRQTCAIPPSTKTSLPVMKLLSSEARKSATAAVSSGRPMRPAGVCAIRPEISASCCPIRANPLRRPGVAVGPGESTFTRIPVVFKSNAQLRAKLRIAALVAL